MKMDKIVVVRKMSELEFYYGGNHDSGLLNLSHEQQQNSLKRVDAILRESGKDYEIITREELSEDVVDSSDLVISAGGDGTIIANAVCNRDTPQLNIRIDEISKGNLCYRDFEGALKNTLDGDFDIVEWTRQDVYLDGSFVARALNETVVEEKGGLAKMAKYVLDEEYHENSGSIIATGTGSSGWPSIFGKYERDSKMFKYKNILRVIGSESGFMDSLSIKYKNHNGRFVVDGVAYDFPRDSVLEIKVSENPLRVVEINKDVGFK